MKDLLAFFLGDDFALIRWVPSMDRICINEDVHLGLSDEPFNANPKDMIALSIEILTVATGTNDPIRRRGTPEQYLSQELVYLIEDQ
ncbi:MAG: hypothetical protein V4671_21990 [Armatimonadota bacterium]